MTDILRTFLCDSSGRPMRRLPLRSETVFGRSYNGASEASWSPGPFCNYEVDPEFHYLGVFAPNEELPYWFGSIVEASASGIRAIDLSDLLTKRQMDPNSLSVAVSASQWIDILKSSADLGGGWAGIPAGWDGVPPIGITSALAFVVEASQDATVDSILSAMVDVGWWWTMEGRYIRFGHLTTAPVGRPLSTTRFTDYNALSPSGPPPSQVIISTNDGQYAVYPPEPYGLPPIRKERITGPDGLNANEIEGLAFNTWLVKNIQFAIGDATLRRPCLHDLRNFLAGRWFPIGAPHGTRLNQGLRYIYSSTTPTGEYYSSASWGIISNVNCKVTTERLSEITLTFSAPEVSEKIASTIIGSVATQSFVSFAGAT